MKRIAIIIIVFVALLVGYFVVDIYGATNDPRAKPPDSGKTSSITVESISEGPEAPSGPTFSMQITSVSECGATCRKIGVQVTNVGDRAQSGISTQTTVSVGRSRLWRDQTRIGRLGGGDSRVLDKTVEVGPRGAAKIAANDGYVLVVTRIETESRIERHERYIKT